MAAGLGFKDFVTGEVLTAADVDGYLMQGIWVFASAAARDAAVTSPQEGNSCYLKDTDVIQVYSGSAWVTKSGGSPLTTKGDLYTFSTSDARLAVGANGTTLVADSAEATGLKWATPSSGGMFLINTGGTTLTGASITINTIPAIYRDLQLVIENFLPATDGAHIKARFNGDTGTRYQDRLYLYNDSEVFGSTSFQICQGNDNTVSGGLSVATIYDYAASTYKMAECRGVTINSTTTANTNFAWYYGFFNQTAAISSITIFPSSGNFTSGTAYLYGVK